MEYLINSEHLDNTVHEITYEQLELLYKGIDRKATINAVIDEKVYDIANHPEGRISVALSKDDFANKILSQDRFTTGFDFEQFRKIFDIIEKIIMK